MTSRLLELLILVAVLAMVTQYAGNERNERGDPTLNLALSLDGVQIGMSYERVLDIRGLPQHLEWEAGTTCFYYGELSSRDIGVWFREGRVVYVGGRKLGLDGVLFDSEKKTLDLLDRFGPFEELATFSYWSPQAGVVLEGHDFRSAGRSAELPIGLRDVKQPPPWGPEAGKQGNSHSWEPWSLHLFDRIYIGDLRLGASTKKVAKEGEVPIYDGGYLRGVKNAREVSHDIYLEHYPASIKLTVGQAPEGPFGLETPLPAPSWLPRVPDHPHVKVTSSNGITESIDVYVEDDELFSALQAYRDSNPPH